MDVHRLRQRYCASVDYDAAERIFAEDVVSFGTRWTSYVAARRCERVSGKASGATSLTSRWTWTTRMHAEAAIRPGEWSHGCPQATTAITSRSTVRGERPLHSNGATESGSLCTPTSPCSPAHHSAPSARGRSCEPNRMRGKDHEGQAWSLLFIMSDTPFPIPNS